MYITVRGLIHGVRGLHVDYVLVDINLSLIRNFYIIVHILLEVQGTAIFVSPIVIWRYVEVDTISDFKVGRRNSIGMHKVSVPRLIVVIQGRVLPIIQKAVMEGIEIRRIAFNFVRRIQSIYLVTFITFKEEHKTEMAFIWLIADIHFVVVKP